MLNRSWRGPRQLRLIFLGVMVLLASMFGCVAWWLLKQDQQLSTQRLVDRQDTAAELVVTTLEKRFSSLAQETEGILAQSDPGVTLPPPGAILVLFEPGLISTWPNDGLVYSLTPPRTPEAPDTLFLAPDELEFQKHDYTAAIAALHGAAASPDAKVRAAALARLARNYRKSGRAREALKASSDLASLGAAPVAGMPAALAGALSSLYTLEQQKDEAALLTAAHSLSDELNSGRWIMSAATYTALSQELQQWLPEEATVKRRAALIEGVEWLWQQWKRDRDAGSGLRILPAASGALLLQWKSDGNRTVGFVADAEYLKSEWLSEIRPRLDNLHVDVALTDSEGHSVLGKSPGAGARPAIRLAPDTALPWTIQAFSTGDDVETFGTRRNLLLAGMGVLLLLILTGTWFIGHAVSRELAVARLKTDFVSTVSHEFRTPLTTLCQLSELLKRDRVVSDQDRQQYYELLHSESNRLRRLVEALLNFGRLESGKLQFHFEPIDAAAFVRQSAAEFVEAQQTRGHRFEIETGESSMVHADRQTLQCVLWNLFENAVKYSPNADTVWVNLSKNGSTVEIAIRDQGVGIPRSEQQRVFDMFVRGTAAKESNVSGTGIGLAMAREIVRAHGGEIRVESEAGLGSTFRVVLPTDPGNV